MPNLEEILARIKDIISEEIGQKKVYDKDVAHTLGLNNLTLATMKKRGKIPYSHILDFCAKRKISINWLFYDQIVESLQNETDKFVRVRYLKNIYASAGGGAENYEDDEECIIIDGKVLDGVGCARVNDLEALNVMGDSMEPTLEDGNIIFIDKSQININKGGIYVVSTPAGLFTKRLQLKADNTIDLISDNKSYGVENVRSDDVRVLGRVVWTMRNLG